MCLMSISCRLPPRCSCRPDPEEGNSHLPPPRGRLRSVPMDFARHCVVISKADVIVIGSGGLGAATAYYLSKHKGLSVVLVDKHDIGSQTSPRAAGMVSCARKSDLMISLIKDACRKIEAFTEETGQPLEWVHTGSLKIARRPQDAEVIKADFERGRRMGLDVELISPEQASCLNPFLKPTGVVAAMRIGDDRYFDPAQVAIGFARRAAGPGA